MKGGPLVRLLALRNRKRNDSVSPVLCYVRTQRDSPVRNLVYGCAHMDYNGCEVIAVFHALLSLGHGQSLQKTAEELAARSRSLWLFGVFGTYPGAIPRYFLDRGFSVRRVSRSRIPESIREGTLSHREKIYIYSYWNPRFRGIHTVELHETPRGWVVFNFLPFYGRTFPSPEALLSAISTPRPILLTAIS